jgi:tetratricopeptide (TPR) repeat protein
MLSVFFIYSTKKAEFRVKKNNSTSSVTSATSTSGVSIIIPVEQSEIPLRTHVAQTFNNCGPASLSMMLSYYDNSVSQKDLGAKLRPYQHPTGDNDDKSVTVAELALEAKNYNLISYYLPNGNMDIIKKLVANGMPVLVRTWLHPNEDIGHYRIVRGYDDIKQEIIQDDSYEGKNRRYSYKVFVEMWQPFNYEYMVLARPDQVQIVDEIIGEDVTESIAWQHAYERAIVEETENQNNVYPIFNQAVALYHLGRYKESIRAFELSQSKIPGRMLWYQIQPIQSYLEDKQYDKVFSLTSAILDNHNRGFTELYLLRGRAYKEQGKIEAARNEFQQAVFYNVNSEEAKQALSGIESF